MKKPDIKKTLQISLTQSVVFIFEGEALPKRITLSNNEEKYALNRFEKGEDCVALNLYDKWIYLIKLKKKGELYEKKEWLRQQASKIKDFILDNGHEELVVASENVYDEAVADFAEGFVLSAYSYDKYKSEKDKQKKVPQLLLYGSLTEDKVAWLNNIIEATYWTRDVINEPVMYMNAKTLASEVSKLGKKSGFDVNVLVGKHIEALKMGGLLAVNKGSVDPPVLCILEYKPDNCVNEKPVVLVGKGIVYDTGGLNIKTGNYMNGMKGDMAGAAAVAGAFSVIAKSKLPIYVIGLLPATDNRPGGNAYTSGDIITMYNKMTVEIGNTDAEGRLILADAISYASNFKPDLIVDIATLTGSAARTFGDKAIATMSNANRKLLSLLDESGKEVFERIAELPFWEDYAELIKSDVADLVNIGKGAEAGAIIAGKFLEKFADAPFIHLDIAGTGILSANDFYRTKEFPGSGMRLLATFVKNLSEKYIC